MCRNDAICWWRRQRRAHSGEYFIHFHVTYLANELRMCTVYPELSAHCSPRTHDSDCSNGKEMILRFVRSFLIGNKLNAIGNRTIDDDDGSGGGGGYANAANTWILQGLAPPKLMG